MRWPTAVAAEPGSRDYGLLSATAQMFARVEKLFTLPPGAFAPPPKVHSSVLRLTMAPRLEELQVEEGPFIAFLKLAFAQKRKTLMNNLRGPYTMKLRCRAALKSAGLRSDVRAEAMSLEKISCGLPRSAARRKLVRERRSGQHARPPVRQPAVAGRFYPANAQHLRAEIETYTTAPASASPATESKIRALGCIVPHAGYIYSGHVAGAVYRRLELPQAIRYSLPQPHRDGRTAGHHERGCVAHAAGRCCHRHGPGEPHEVEAEAAVGRPDRTSLRARARGAASLSAVLVPGFRFVPITVGTSNFEVLSALGVVIANVAAEAGEPMLVVASSDMNHYENDSVTRVKDHRAIDQVLLVDPRGLYDIVHDAEISMCGYGPAVVMLTAARKLGATKAELLRYATSGDVSGDRDMVVGYAGIAVF